ncbi:MAG: hypothetical protein IPJ34_19330, partial [Myxococcales bacterium]|nr:hypothetical protein [Myxococcales bacterium]
MMTRREARRLARREWAEQRLLVRRFRAPIAFVTCAAFWLSLAWIVPQPARAQEAEPISEPLPTTEGASPTVAAPSPSEAKPSPEAATGPAPTAPTGVDKAGLPDVAQKAEAPMATVGLPTGANKTGVSSQAISVPQGTGKIQGMGESFSAQLSTGIATFAVPFAPPRRGGAQPSLGLSYSSGNGHGIAGVGWEIGAPYIARQTDRGVPQYKDGTAWTPQQDRFVFNGGQELVPICLVGTDCTGKLIAGEVIPATFNGWQYF